MKNNLQYQQFLSTSPVPRRPENPSNSYSLNIEMVSLSNFSTKFPLGSLNDFLAKIPPSSNLNSGNFLQINNPKSRFSL